MNYLKRIKLKVLKSVSYKMYTKELFKLYHNYNLNLKEPKSFNEKIQWMKFNGNLEKYAKYVDKNDVRSYISDKVGERILIPQIGCYSSSEDINFDELPSRFVIKATHASGWNLVVKNKDELNIVDAKSKIDNWIKSSFYEMTGEANYKNVPGRVVIEEFIEDSSGDLLDYRFYCYDGKPLFIQLDSYADIKKRRNIYDINWGLLNCKCGYDNIIKIVEKPSNLDEMVEVASKLSKGFNFVRVDLYYVNNKIYFGELTFTPQNGFGKFTPTEFDFKFGKPFLIDRIEN